MITKTYNISGFDCPNCARKSEEHLAKHPNISSVRLDFSANKLHVSYENAAKELSIKQLLDIIKEVEVDKITITPIDTAVKKTSILTKDLYILLARILFGVIVIILSFTAFHDTKYFWVNFALYLIALIVITYDIFIRVIKHIIHKENPIDEYLLIIISSFGAFAIASIEHSSHDFMESVMVVLLFQLGRVIESIATNKSKEAIKSAVELRVEEANILNEHNEIIKKRIEDIKVNDTCLVVAGEVIPIDGVVIKGNGNIDVSSLTGEYVPVVASLDTQVYSGTAVKTGSIYIKVLKEYKDSTIHKIMELISTSGEKKSKSDKFITKFARIYTPVVLLVSILFGVIGGLITQNWSTYLLNGLKMLVVACPCAIVISIPLAYFSALGLASKQGIVVKGTNHLEELVRMKKLICDKTGTLTHGAFSVQKVSCVKGVSEKELMNYLYVGEVLSSHPIGKAICHGVDLKKVAGEIKSFSEESGKGTVTSYKNKVIICGNITHLLGSGIKVPEVSDYGTIIYCAVDNKYIGYVILSDTIKPDAQPMVDLLHNEGIEIILLTGDKKENAKNICESLGIDRYQAELLPEDKTNALVSEMSTNNKYAVGFIGDGINDASSIKRSDIGIAMGGIGSDVAVENADIVIMNDDPAKVWDALKIAKMARHTAIFNLVFALLVKISIEIVIAIIGEQVPMFVAVLADTGLTVLLVINSLVLLYRKVKRKRI